MSISPLDAYEDHFPVGYVAFFERTLHPTLIVRSLVEVMGSYPLLSGRMTRDARGKKAIALNDAGLGFELDESIETLADWRDPDRNAIGKFVRLVIPQDPLRARQPLMNVRLTQLAGGGSVLGIGFSHVLSDGSGIAAFVRDWAKVARGERMTPPMWDRDEHARAFRVSGFDPSTVPIHDATYHGLHEATLGELARLYAHLLRAFPEWKAYTIPLSGREIDDLKAAANAGREEKLSSNDILSAFFWKLFNESLEPYGDRRSRFFGVVDLRRHTPGVPERGVFGNMSGHTLIEATIRETTDVDLHTLALELRREARSITERRFAEQEVWLRHRQETRRMYRVLGAEPYSGDVAVSNCRYIPFYDMDFGEGRPYFFNLPAEKFPRIVIWPAASGDGCVVNVNLDRRMAEKLLPVLTRPRLLEAHER